MAHFAKINENKLVEEIIVVPNEEEHRGQQFINEDLNVPGVWLQTSYNTHKGIHYNPETNEPSADQSKAFRKNYAGIGYSYDEERDAFIPPKIFNSWILDEFSCDWIAPIPKPTEGLWQWNEELGNWEEIELPE